MSLTLIPIITMLVAGLTTAIQVVPRQASSEAIDSFYRQEYRQMCPSEPGVEIAMRRLKASRPMREAIRVRAEAAGRDVVDAIAARLVNVTRIERVLRAQERVTTELSETIQSDYIATLRQLSPADRAAFAGSLAVFRPGSPAPACATAPG